MEKRIELTTKTSFNVSEKELEHFYAVMSLLQYHHHRTPDYNELTLIRRLRNEFERYNEEISKACEKEPNNLRLTQIRIFIQHHYGYLKKITKDLTKNLQK